MSEILLQVENLRISYPGSEIWAVDEVSFALQSGERLGLVGESGCGKSTLGRAVMRLVPPRTRLAGKVWFEGKSVFELNPTQLRKFRGEVVSLVFQDPMTRLDPLMTIGDHCLETLQAHEPSLSKREAKERAIRTLEAVRIPASRWGQYPHEFSGGMRQRVAIALALLLDPKAIVADEPTTSLDVTVSAEILDELTRLCQEQNMALLLISHDLATVGEYCDRVAVMYQGKMVEMGTSQQILQHPEHPYTQSLVASALHIQAVNEVTEFAPLTSKIGKIPLLQVKGLQQYFTLEGSLLQQFLTQETQVIKAVDDVSFDLYAGEILGLVGESGCGKSTLSRTILRLLDPTAGEIMFDGQDISQATGTQLRSLRREMQMVFQDPHACLNPMMTVGRSIADPLYIHKLATGEKAQAEVEQMLERVGLIPVAEYYGRYPAELSGGQQQRVAIARALITRPKLIICDEPVSMLDASVQTQVLELMLDLKEEFNLTYLFITHDLSVARFLCDRIAVMTGGKIVEIGKTSQIFRQPQHPYTQKLLNAVPLLAT